jgi:hypothetical protein
MNLGLGLIAADSYFKEGDARVLRQREQDRYDAEKQRTTSELSLLGDKTEADRSGYQLRRGQNTANAELLPGQTANAQTRIGLDAAELEGQSQRQPDDLKTKGIQSGLALTTAQQAQTTQPTRFSLENNKLEAEKLTSEATLKQLPQRLARAATQGVIDQQGQADVVLGTMGQLIARQDKAGALAFANEIAKNGDLLPSTNGKTFTDIIPVRKGQNGAQGDGYVFVTADGDRKFAPVEAIQGAMGKLKSGKYKFIERTDGSIFAGDEGSGRGGIVQQGDPAMLKGRNAQHTPAEIQTMEWLIGKGVAKDAASAWEMVRSSREKTRNSFIMEYVSKNALPGADTNKLSDDAGRIYDALRQNQGPVNPPSNSPAPGKFDPAISSLIGIP